ncbi:MAG: glycosyltransferase [Gammaproteobacteria bacterium]
MKKTTEEPVNTTVQVVQHMAPGGIETMAIDLTNFCGEHERGMIISLEGNHSTSVNHWPRLKPLADKLIFLGKQAGLQPLLILRLVRLFKSLNVDAVHTHHIGPLLYAGLAARLAGVKHLIYTEHDAWHLDDKKQCSLERWAIRILQPRLVADADNVAARMRVQLRCKDEIKVIRNGIDTEHFLPGDQYDARQLLGLPQNVKIIGCSGRLEEVKGQKNLIQAMIQLPDNIHLALAGSGNIEKKLRDLVNSLGINDRVHFLGRIDEMPSFYQALDAFCLPSLNEGLPLSPLEAQACNIPTAVTDVGGSCETLCPNSGELIPAGNIKAIAHKMKKILSIPMNANEPRRFVQKNGDVRVMSQAYSALRFTGD